MQYEEIRQESDIEKDMAKFFELMEHKFKVIMINILRDLIVMYEYRWNI